jgi:hypothetical protein
VRAALDPIVAATFPIPKIALLPLIMLAFGIGEGSKITIVAIAVIYLVLINTMIGVLTIDRIYFDVAKNFGAPWPKLFARVIIPGALPLIFSGLRLSMGVSLIVIVSAEFVAAKSGIGYDLDVLEYAAHREHVRRDNRDHRPGGRLHFPAEGVGARLRSMAAKRPVVNHRKWIHFRRKNMIRAPLDLCRVVHCTAEAFAVETVTISDLVSSPRPVYVAIGVGS